MIFFIMLLSILILAMLVLIYVELDILVYAIVPTCPVCHQLCKLRGNDTCICTNCGYVFKKGDE